ncbi:MAG TPA: hypothetical protein VLO11_02935, partial [Luteolibacter sp.]|nr:hypothetical protein [Luteolibacter sp.]
QALAMLMPQLARQAAVEPLPEPRLEGAELDPEALAAISAWQKPLEKQSRPSRPDMRHYHMSSGAYIPDLWLLGGDDPEQPLQGVHATLLERGMDALPVLAALADDPFLTVIPYQNRGGHVYYSSRESEEELILRAYQQMPRPATRGELACQLLAATLPDPDDQLDEADATSLRSLAMDFWKQNRDKSRDDLLLVFMSQGSAQQASQVAVRLASSTSPEARATFEKHVLAAENPLNFIQPVTIYLRQRRAEGKAFYDSYAKRVREYAEMAGDDIERSWEIRQAGGIDKMLKSLQSLASPESPRSIARNIARGEPEEAEAGIQGLAALIENEDPSKQLEIYLEGANTTVDPTVRCLFIAATYNIEWPQDEEADTAESGEDKDTAPPPPRAISGTEAIIWRKLLADDREVPEKLRGRFDLGKSPTIGKLAASAFETSVSRFEAFSLQEAAPALGKPLADYLYERATARISGSTVPPVPDASRVTDEHLKEIVAETSRLPTSEIQAHIGKLSPDERVKWMAWLKEPVDPPLPTEFLRLKNRILNRSAQSFYGITDQPGVFGIDTGFTIDSENLKTHLQTLAGDIATHSPVLVAIQKSALGPGMEILAHRMEPSTAENTEDADGEKHGSDMDPRRRIMDSIFQRHAQTMTEHSDIQGVIALIATDGQGGKSSTLWLRDGKLVAPAEDVEISMWGIEENPDEFKALLDDFLPSAESKTFYLRIECLAREHAAIFNPNHE